MVAPDVGANALLAQLPDRELEVLRAGWQPVEIPTKTTVYEAGGPIAQVYFPLDSVFSLVATTQDHAAVEVATIGREGMAGLPLFLGASSSPHACFCQIPGWSICVEADVLRRALATDGALRRALNRFTQATMVQIAQNVVCNNTHSTEQRAARWLLTTQDRVERDEFPLTQEFLAQMLGVRRPTVSEVASNLQGKELIRYRRGQMTISDRKGLETLTCGCYEVVRREFDALMGRPSPDAPVD